MTPQYILRASLCREPYCAENATKRDREFRIENMSFASNYAEPGYDDPKKGILFSDWNYFPRDIGDVLERAGYAIEWEDEWSTCDNCGAAFRTSPDSYFWQPNYLSNRETGESFCKDCLTADDIETYEDNPNTAVNVNGLDLSKFGYQEIQCGYQSGLHAGMNDDPKKIFDALKARGHKRILFSIDDQSQFYIGFCVYEKLRNKNPTEA